jgi:hypothetical protein
MTSLVKRPLIPQEFDFTRAAYQYYCTFLHGTIHSAVFQGQCNPVPRQGSTIFVSLNNGRVGRYYLYYVNPLRDYSYGFRAIGDFQGYKEDYADRVGDFKKKADAPFGQGAPLPRGGATTHDIDAWGLRSGDRPVSVLQGRPALRTDSNWLIL